MIKYTRTRKIWFVIYPKHIRMPYYYYQLLLSIAPRCLLLALSNTLSLIHRCTSILTFCIWNSKSTLLLFGFLLLTPFSIKIKQTTFGIIRHQFEDLNCSWLIITFTAMQVHMTMNECSFPKHFLSLLHKRPPKSNQPLPSLLKPDRRQLNFEPTLVNT